ncbi:MAG: hypothetical protein VW989_03915 [Rhodobiaceae bacterium]|jgi:hypothetical protein
MVPASVIFAARTSPGTTIRRPDPDRTRPSQTIPLGRLHMSRLAEAQAKLEDALQQLEAALANRPTDMKAHATGTDHIVDRAAIIAEIGRIDEQLSSAMQIIDRVRHASGSKGGTA